MGKHCGGNANEDLLRDLRLAVWRHKEPEGEFMILAQIRQTLDHAGIAYDGCRLYRVQADNGECTMRVHPLTADGHWSPLTKGQQWVLGAWKSAATCYRAPSRHGECAWLAQQMRCNVKAILETTFDQGVLAVYRKEAIACSDADIGLFKGLGEVLSGLYYRQEDLAQLQTKEAQLRQAQKLQVMGQLTAEFTGEINQYLEVIIGETSLLSEGDLAPVVSDGVQAVYEAGLQARSTSERLLGYARQPKTQKEWVNFTHLVQETVRLLRRTLLQDQIEIVETLAPDLPYIKAHAGQLQQVVLNLIQNSREAIKQVRDAGRIALRLSARQGWIVLKVEDNGLGIPEEIRTDIFAPFFTTKASSQHSGLGLSVCAGIARDHHGRLFIENCAQGACVVLELPINPPAALVDN
ncbi:MAG: HAMP domain-containing histidine kinase [Gemmatimonadetes bacterium]|nr:HAMP domain-containing histidine kinase [Gemmatimonadota bacterium]MYB69909.1 HAMP domain-containing histidine kinase [Gemmatimonadota bacterium]